MCLIKLIIINIGDLTVQYEGITREAELICLLLTKWKETWLQYCHVWDDVL